MRRAAVLAAAVAIAGVLAPAPVAGAEQTIRSAGPLEAIAVGADLTCDVRHAGDARPAFFGGSGCGTFVAMDCVLLGLPVNCVLPGLILGGALFGPGQVPSAGQVGRAFTPVEQSAVQGAGTADDPWRIVTTVALAATGMRLAQTDSYVAGAEEYRTQMVVSNNGLLSQTAVLYRAANCVVGGEDEGFGSEEPESGAVACTAPSGRVEQWRPAASGSRRFEAAAPDVWSRIASRRPFPDTCRCFERVDNGAGLSWTITVPAGGSVTRAHTTAFAAPPPPPVLGESVNLAPTRGVVTVRPPGASRFVRLLGAAQIPLGSRIDTLRGAVDLISASDDLGGTQSANFFEGVFKVVQEDLTTLPVTELRLVSVTPRAPGAPGAAGARAAASITKKRVKQLWGKAKGRFRTKGRSSAATVRGTTWLVRELQGGTLTFVDRGEVDVRDDVLGRTVTLRAGQRYVTAVCGRLRIGGPGPDVLTGGRGRDTLSGRGGPDVLDGGRGMDCIHGQGGDDRIEAADGEVDVVRCGPGDDTVRADPIDRLSGCEHVRRR